MQGSPYLHLLRGSRRSGGARTASDLRLGRRSTDASSPFLATAAFRGHAIMYCSTGAGIINAPRMSPFPSTQRCAFPENRRGNKHAVPGPRTDRQIGAGRPHLAAVQNTIQQLSSACRLIYGAPTGEVGTTFQSRPRPGMERGSKSGSLHYGRLFFCALAPSSSLALGTELPARPTQPIPLPAALHSICVRRSMC